LKLIGFFTVIGMVRPLDGAAVSVIGTVTLC